MSDNFDRSNQSSALYLNQIATSKSNKSRSHHSNEGGVEFHVRVIKGLIDAKNMIRELFIRLGIVMILGIGISMIVNGILFYFLFINLPDCDLAELEAAKYPIIINPKYENKNTIIPTKDTLSSNDKFFWQSQLYDEMRNSHKKILAQIDKQIDTSIMKLIESVEKSIQEINHKVQSFYLRLGSAQDMELAMPNDRGKRRTLTAPFPTPRISITTRNRGIGWFRPEGAPGIKSRCNSSTNHLTPKPP